MSGPVFELFAKLILDSSEYESGLGKAKGEADKAGGGIKAALGSAGKAVAAGVTAATAAVVGFGKSSVETGMEFDAAMSQVAATMGFSVEDLHNEGSEAAQTFKALRNFALDMGSSTQFSSTQAAEALNYMALAGYDAEKAMGMMPNVLNLAAAGNMDLARASDMVTDAQSALGLSMDDTTIMVDQMARTASRSNTSVAQLGDAILTIGATAKGVKGGTTELSTILGVMADNGIKGSEAGTHLRNMLMSLQNPTKEGTDALEELGISVYDADGNMRSMIDIIAEMQVSMAGMDRQSRDTMVSGIFNKYDLAAVNALLDTSQGRFEELTEEIRNAHGAAEEMAAVQMDNLQGGVISLQSAMEGLRLAVSDSLTPTLQEFGQYGVESVQQLTKAFREDGLQGALEALGPIIDEGISLLFSKLPEILDAAVELLDAFVLAIVNNLPKLVPAAVQIVEHIVQTISDNIEQLTEAAVQIILALADGLIEAIPQIIPAIFEITLAIVEKLTEPETLEQLIEAAVLLAIAIAEGLIRAIPKIIVAVPTIIENIYNSIIGLTDKAIEAGKTFMSGMAGGFEQAETPLMQKINEIGEKVGGWLDEYVVRPVTEFFTKVQQKIEGFFGPAIETVRTKLESIGETIITKWEEIKTATGEKLQAIKQKIEEIWEPIKEAIAGKLKGIQEKITSAWQEIRDTLQPLLDALKYLFETIWEAIQVVVSRKMDEISEKLTQGWNEIVEFVSPILESLRTSIEAGWEAIKNAIYGAMDAISERINSAWNAIVEFLTPTLENIRVAMEAGWDNIKTTVSNAMDLISEKVTSVWNVITEFFSTVLENIRIAFEAGWENIKATVSNTMEAIRETITNIWNSIVERATKWGSDLIDNIISGIKGAISSLADAANSAADAIHDYLGFSTPKKGPLHDANEYGGEFIKLLVDGIDGSKSSLENAASNAANSAKEGIKKKWEDAKKLGNDLIEKIKSGVSEKVSSLMEVVTKIGNDISKFFSNFAGNARTLGAGISTSLHNGFASNISSFYGTIQNLASEVQNGLGGLISAARNWGSDLMTNFVNGIIDEWNSLISALSDMAQAVSDMIGFSQPKKGPLSNFHTYAPDMVDLFAKGIRDNKGLITDAIGSTFDVGPQMMSGFSQGATILHGNGASRTAGGNQTVVLQVGRTELGRLVYELFNEEQQRVGVRLESGGVA